MTTTPLPRKTSRLPERLPLDDPAEVRLYVERQLLPYLREHCPVDPAPRVSWVSWGKMRGENDLGWTRWDDSGRARIDLDARLLWHYRLAVENLIHEWAHARVGADDPQEHGPRWGREYQRAYHGWFDYE